MVGMYAVILMTEILEFKVVWKYSKWFYRIYHANSAEGIVSDKEAEVKESVTNKTNEKSGSIRNDTRTITSISNRAATGAT